MNGVETKFFLTLVENLDTSIRFVDGQKRIIYINPYGERLLGSTKQDIVGRLCDELNERHTDSDGQNLCDTMCPLDYAFKGNRVYEGRNYFRSKNNNIFPVEIRVIPVFDPDQKIVGVVEVMRDDRPRMEIEEIKRDIQRMIPVDLLTGLYTRHKIMEYLEVKVENAVRYGSSLGVMIATVCELTGIKKEFGIKKVEEVMQRIGYLFRMNMRRGDICGRFGPDQILVLLPNTKEEETRAAARKMKRVIEEDSTLVIPGKIHITIGTSQYSKDDTVSDLVTRAQKETVKNP